MIPVPSVAACKALCADPFVLSDCSGVTYGTPQGSTQLMCMLSSGNATHSSLELASTLGFPRLYSQLVDNHCQPGDTVSISGLQPIKLKAKCNGGGVNDLVAVVKGNDDGDGRVQCMQKCETLRAKHMFDQLDPNKDFTEACCQWDGGSGECYLFHDGGYDSSPSTYDHQFYSALKYPFYNLSNPVYQCTRTEDQALAVTAVTVCCDHLGVATRDDNYTRSLRSYDAASSWCKSQGNQAVCSSAVLKRLAPVPYNATSDPWDWNTQQLWTRPFCQDPPNPGEDTLSLKPL